jgi:AraC-like DNA-binding protein/mannose-6-phosphate isomerase-like protein (cupin superfamily)
VAVTGSDRSGDGFDVRSLAITCRDGHRLGDHTHAWAQLIYALSGLMIVEAEGSAWFVPPTRAIWIPPRIPHRIAFRGEVALRTLYISDQRANGVRRAVEAFEVSPLLSELIVHILSEAMLDPRLPQHDRLAGVLVDLIGAAPALDFALPLPRDERALKLAEQLRDDPAGKRDLQALAIEAGASLRTLQRCFSDETGFTIDAWRQKARLIHAAAALAGGASVTAAAVDCGYDSPSAFIAAFRKQFGVTPGRFQNG